MGKLGIVEQGADGEVEVDSDCLQLSGHVDRDALEECVGPRDCNKAAVSRVARKTGLGFGRLRISDVPDEGAVGYKEISGSTRKATIVAFANANKSAESGTTPGGLRLMKKMAANMNKGDANGGDAEK